MNWAGYIGCATRAFIIIHNYKIANHADPCYYHAYAHATDAAYGATAVLINSMCTNCNCACIACILIEESLLDSLHVDVTLHGILYYIHACIEKMPPHS